MTAWLNGPVHFSKQVLGHALELGAGQRLLEVEGALLGGGDERQVDGRRLSGGQLDLGLLGGLLEPLRGHLVLRQVDPVGVLEALDEVLDDALVPVVAAQVRVARSRLDLEDTVAEIQQRHIEGSAAEVEDKDGLVLTGLVEPVGEGRRSGLVDDPQHFETGNLPSLLGGLALRVVEVGGDGDDDLGHLVGEIGLGIGLELLQDARRDLLGRVALGVDGVLVVRAHLALDRADRAIGVGDRLALCDLADEDLAGLGERHHRGRGSGTLGVGNYGGLATLEHGDHRVGRAEVYSYCFGHLFLLGFDYGTEYERSGTL